VNLFKHDKNRPTFTNDFQQISMEMALSAQYICRQYSLSVICSKSSMAAVILTPKGSVSQLLT